MLTLILGGARSGKSRLAQRLAEPAGRVCYIATYQSGDDPEMAARIERHRAERPGNWLTIEEPLALADAVESAANRADTVLVDCLTIWLSNLLWEHRDRVTPEVAEMVRSQIRRIAAAVPPRRVIVVSNELGCGIVPESAVARAFRDIHGLMNQWMAEAADEVILTVAGLPLYLKTMVQREGSR